MFRETLIESSPQLRKRKGWPMAAALTLQAVAVIVLIVTPLITTGVIPLSAHTIVFTPPTYKPMPAHADIQPGGNSGGRHTPDVVAIANRNPNAIPYGAPATIADANSPTAANPTLCCPGPGVPDGLYGNNSSVILKPPVKKPVPVSVLSEALLINKVVPEYPMPAQHAGVQGDVKLHAIISRDGSIQSLSLISGHPLLAAAALAAVQQWRYRPYVLNGEPVEVETWITVSFRKDR